MALDLGTLTGYLALDDGPMQGTLDRMPRTLEGAGVAMGAAGLALGAYIGMELVQGFGRAANAERLNDRLAAALNLDPSAATRAGQVAGRLYVDAYGESLEEVNGAVEAVMSAIPGMMDAPAESLEGVTANVLDLATAFEVDVGRSAQIAGQWLSDGLVADAEEGVDLLAAALQRVPATVREDVMDAADEYGPFFASLGMDGAQAMALLVDGAESGMYGIDKMGDALKEFQLRVGNMDPAAMAQLTNLGLDADAMASAVARGGDDAAAAMDTIVGALQSVEDPAARGLAAVDLFGAPFEDMGGVAGGFLDTLSGVGDGMTDFAGTASDVGEQVNDNIGTSWTSVQRTFDSVWSGIAANLLPVLGELAAWAAENPELMNAIVVGLMVFAGVLLIAAAAQWAMNSALLASPITWIVLGIAALVAGLILLAMNWESVAAWIGEVWGGFVGWLTEVTAGLAAWWNELWAGFGAWVTEVWNGFIGWIVGVWSGFVGWLFGIGAAIAAWWNGLWSSVGAFVQAAWNGIVAWVTGIVVGWIAGLIAQGQRIIAWWTGLWTTVRTGVTSAWNGIVSWLGGIGGRILDAFSGAGQWLVSIGRNILDGLMGGLRAGWDAVVGWIQGLGGGIIDTFASILGIRSPSLVFRMFGRNIVEGLGLGIDDEAGTIGPRVEGLVTVPDPDDYDPRRGFPPPDGGGGSSGRSGSSTYVLVDRDGAILATMRGAASERSELDGTTATLGRKSPVGALP